MSFNKEDFTKLYEHYKNQLISEQLQERYILSEEELLKEGENGIYLMLAVLYSNQEKSASLFDTEAEAVPTDASVGLPPEVCEVASRLLGRQVTREDKNVLFHLRAVKMELSDKAFDELTRQLNKKDTQPTPALVKLMARKTRWKN